MGNSGNYSNEFCQRITGATAKKLITNIKMNKNDEELKTESEENSTLKLRKLNLKKSSYFVLLFNVTHSNEF